MHQEHNFKELQKRVKNRELTNRFIAYKLEKEKICNIEYQEQNLLVYLTTEKNTTYEIKMHQMDFLDCSIKSVKK